MKHLPFFLVVCTAVFAGCGGTSPGTNEPASPGGTPAAAPAAPQAAAPAVGRLANTDWRLVEIQSMDDAQGTTRPGDPALYTMRLNADGTVQMRLNCNRANGTWSAAPGDNGTSGRFEFGPLAGTRALCPPPSLDERITSQAQYVRSYLLKDGRLYLSLMADGGIYAWEPLPAGAPATAPGTAEGAPATSASGSLPSAVVDLIKKEYSSPDLPPTRYFSGTADLNGDGRPELLVHVVGPMACGTGGCPTLVFTPTETGYALVSTIAVTRPPIRMSPRSAGGWRNLIVKIAGGGGRSGHAELAHTVKGYPENPTVPPARRINDLAGAETVIPEFASFEEATPLPPLDGRGPGCS